MTPTNKIDDALVNRLLSALPDGEFAKIRPALEKVELKAGDVLWEAETKHKYIFFPTTAIVCLIYDSDTGVSIEVGITGRQGLVGVATFMSEAPMATRAVTYRKGHAYRMHATAVKEEFGECGDFQDICMYYTQTLISQVSQSAICNQLHSVDQKLCRFLLYIHDHQQKDLVVLTHEQIAQALGVRRETVSLSAANLQKNKLIKYSRGRINVLDRSGLESLACECYGVETEHYRRVLGKYMAKHK